MKLEPILEVEKENTMMAKKKSAMKSCRQFTTDLEP